MERRLEAFHDPIAPEISAAASPDFGSMARELAALMRPASCGFDLSVTARMGFPAWAMRISAIPRPSMPGWMAGPGRPVAGLETGFQRV
ncbi:hypothetical protein [Paracoccus binzhouensis]|uniref:hypothetical protein n=1 Tax=Paracoccus binzhouensis TaxID=2796149 RepID=UPI0018EED3F9|nr:hypothetical protein [Paracoccus binzhouensis]